MNNQKLTIDGVVTYSRLFDALKGMYEVDDDDSVWEIFNQADDQIEEVVNALKLLSTPPAPVVPEGWKLVLVEPTWEMLAADGCSKHHKGQECSHHENRKRIWRAMLEAVPKPED